MQKKVAGARTDNGGSDFLVEMELRSPFGASVTADGKRCRFNDNGTTWPVGASVETEGNDRESFSSDKSPNKSSLEDDSTVCAERGPVGHNWRMAEGGADQRDH